jgi:hypothetical protein
MSDELEKRLRELYSDHDALTQAWPPSWAESGLKLLREAARIGAEIEREECEQIAEIEAARSTHATQARTIVAAIRARGGK